MITPVETQPLATSSSRRVLGCFSTLGCPSASLEDVVELAIHYRLPCLELRSLENGTDLPGLLASRPGGWAGTRQFLRARGLQVRVLGTSFKLVGNTPGDWMELWSFAALADALDVPYLRIFGGGVWGTPLSESDFSQAVETLQHWERDRANRNLKVEILIETHDAFSSSIPCLRLLEKKREGVNFLWDSHHTWRLAGESPQTTWDMLGPYIRHIHVKDSLPQPSARHPYTYVLPGRGQMPYTALRRTLQEGGYSGALSLEWEKRWHPYLPELSEALTAAEQESWLDWEKSPCVI
jgi:sugar phosphate isomerase/epimerase